jgi:hypothetical protein
LPRQGNGNPLPWPQIYYCSSGGILKFDANAEKSLNPVESPALENAV